MRTFLIRPRLFFPTDCGLESMLQEPEVAGSSPAGILEISSIP